VSFFTKSELEVKVCQKITRARNRPHIIVSRPVGKLHMTVMSQNWRQDLWIYEIITIVEQNRRQKVVNGGVYVCVGGLYVCAGGGAWRSNLTKIPHTDRVPYFNLGGLAHYSSLWRWDCSRVKESNGFT